MGRPRAAGTEPRPFSCAELTCLLPGQIETPERTYSGILIWGEGVFELKYESMSIKGYRPEPYRHLLIYPRPLHHPSDVLCKDNMLHYLLSRAISHQKRPLTACRLLL